jgi:hypothetical protein
MNRANMSKPILVVRLPIPIDQEQMIEIGKVIDSRCPDYNTLIFRTSYVDSIEFEVFNVQDYTPIQFEELKQLIEKV